MGPGWAWSRNSAASRGTSRRALVEENLNVGQYMALSHIARHPGINRASLGGGLQVTPKQ
jgi:hypothetical protein